MMDDLRERWNDAQARMRDVAARVRPILGDVLLSDLAGATKEMIAITAQLVELRDADVTVIAELRAVLGPQLPCGRYAVFARYRPRYQDEPPVLSCDCGNYCHEIPPDYDEWWRRSQEGR